MLTYVPERIFARDERPAYRPYRVTVRRLERLSAHFLRVTFTSDQLEFFGTDARDQRVKIVFPLPGVGFGDFGADDPRVALDGSWYSRLRELPEHERNLFRTYTVRGVRPADRELDVDFVVHPAPVDTGSNQPIGPAASWIARVAVGDTVIIVGPDARSLDSAVGIDWHPGDAREVLLAGDETAAPAICAILEGLPPELRARAFIEVPDAGDALPLRRNAEVVTWLPRGQAAPGEVLEPAVRAWVAANRDVVAPALAAPAHAAAATADLLDIDVDVDLLWESPEDEHRGFYAWLAGEAGAIKSLRRFLVSETGIDRHAVAFMGYWRTGLAERQG